MPQKRCVCMQAPEFGPTEGHFLVIEKVSHGLHASGARFHAKFADALHSLGFTPTYADPNAWMGDAGDCYEYVVVCIDDTLTTLKDPDSFHKEPQSDPWNYTLKNDEEPKHHLGGDFFGDEDRKLCCHTQTHLKRLADTYKELFEE